MMSAISGSTVDRRPWPEAEKWETVLRKEIPKALAEPPKRRKLFISSRLSVSQSVVSHQPSVKSKPLGNGTMATAHKKSFISSKREWLLDAALMALPLTSLYGSLDYLVHLQFSFDKDFGWERILSRVLPVGLSLFGVSLLALRFKHLAIVQCAFALGAFASGAALIHFSTDDGTFGCVLVSLDCGLLQC